MLQVHEYMIYKLKIKGLSIQALIVLITFNACTGQSLNQPGSIELSMKNTVLKKKFDDFNRLNDPDLIKDALYQIDIALNNVTVENPEYRKTGLEMWLYFFYRLDGIIDTAWDKNDLPAVAIVPPAVEGKKYPSGIDPSEIKDEKIRNIYEKAILANKEKALKYAIQLQLERIEHMAIQNFEIWVSKHLNNTSEIVALKKLFDKIDMTENRKKQLLSIISSQHKE